MTNSTDTNTVSRTDNGSTGPKLIMIRGLPGSGKSYLAAALRDSLGADKVLLLDPDATDYTSAAYHELSENLTAEGVDAKFHPYRFLRRQAYDAIEAGKDIIWNQAFTNLDGFNKTVVNLQAYAAEHGTQLPLLVVEMAISEDAAKARVAQRAQSGGHDVAPETFARFINEYASFASQGFNTVAINGEDDIAVSAATVLTALQNIT